MSNHSDGPSPWAGENPGQMAVPVRDASAPHGMAVSFRWAHGDVVPVPVEPARWSGHGCHCVPRRFEAGFRLWVESDGASAEAAAMLLAELAAQEAEYTAGQEAHAVAQLAARREAGRLALRDLVAAMASEPTDGQAAAHLRACPPLFNGVNLTSSRPVASGLVATDALEISGADWAPVWVSRIQDVDPRPRGEVVWQAELEEGMGAEPVPEGTPGAIIAPCDWAAMETLARYGLAFDAGMLWFLDRTSRSARALVVRVNGRQIRLS